MSILAHNLKTIRQSKNLTQKEFADLLKSNQKTISAYENERIKIANSDILLGIANQFGISPETFTSVKLKTNQKGDFTNLPKSDGTIDLIKRELNTLVSDLENEHEKFKKSISKIFERLNQLERKINTENK